MASGRLAGRLALVTGASRGIGAAVARRFAAEGARLVLVARTTGGLEEVDDEVQRVTGETATLVPMDLLDGAQVDQLGGALAGRFGKLDILVANAATLGELSPVGHYAPDTWERTIALNLGANWRLIRSLDPLLRASESGRAIFVTAEAAKKTPAFWGPYAASKAGLEAMVGCYAAEVRRTALRVNLLDPGPVATALRKEAYPGEDATKLPAPDAVTEPFVALAEEGCDRHGERVGPPPTD
jgi:NAD(P)-dependent dehydrogenase (short-subunit alcohol dehydrogenase family)